MKKHLTLALACCLGTVLAQDPDATDENLQTTTAGDETNSPVAFYGWFDYWSPVDLDSSDNEYNLYAAHLHAPIAGKAGETLKWIVELDAELTRFDINGIAPTPLLADRDLYAIGVDASFLWTYPNSKWSPFLRFSPTINSDFGGSITSDDIRISGAIGTFWQQNENLKWLFGVLYQENFESTPLLPFVGFDWTISDTLNLSILGPRLNFTYQPEEHWKVGLFAEAHSRNWNVENSNGSTNFEVFSSRGGAFVNYRVAPKFWVTAETGVTFANSLEVQSTSGSTLFEDDADSGFFFNVGFRVPL